MAHGNHPSQYLPIQIPSQSASKGTGISPLSPSLNTSAATSFHPTTATKPSSQQFPNWYLCILSYLSLGMAIPVILSDFLSEYNLRSRFFT